MYKVAPAIHRIGFAEHLPMGQWACHDYMELLECVNSLRHTLFGKLPISPLELLERFEGMNTAIENERKPEINIILATIVRSDAEPGEQQNANKLTEELVRELAEGKSPHLAIYTPAGWGMRVLEAVRKHGERSVRLLVGRKVKSKVTLNLLHGEYFIM